MNLNDLNVNLNDLNVNLIDLNMNLNDLNVNLNDLDVYKNIKDIRVYFVRRPDELDVLLVKLERLAGEPRAGLAAARDGDALVDVPPAQHGEALPRPAARLLLDQVVGRRGGDDQQRRVRVAEGVVPVQVRELPPALVPDHPLPDVLLLRVIRQPPVVLERAVVAEREETRVVLAWFIACTCLKIKEKGGILRLCSNEFYIFFYEPKL